MAIATSPTLVWAGPGDDHSHPPTAAGASGALPRFAATSDAFELVGVLEGTELTLYLDRAADNSPVKDAQLHLEVGGTKVEVKAHADGEFRAMLAQLPRPGIVPVTATVIAGADSDLLAGELDLQTAEHADPAHRHTWKEYAGWIAAAMGTIALLVWLALRLRRARAQRNAA
jgi:hypothetical protein